MKFSLVNGIKTEAMPGGKGICSCCESETIAKCGNYKIWHWAHKSNKNCDSWWESETEWHRLWKSYFPIENQEVVHKDIDSGEKHIADVKTLNGMVIEFQNSPIAAEELKAREAFYKRVIWIVNGDSFKNRFLLTSPLPDPSSEFSQNIEFAGDYYKKYENTKSPNSRGVSHPLISIHSLIHKYHTDHFRFYWKNKHETWLAAKQHVLFDFGDTVLWWLKREFRGKPLSYVQRIEKEALIAKNGGTFIRGK
jgi:competence CoiA-like predicted nuclease